MELYVSMKKDKIDQVSWVEIWTELNHELHFLPSTIYPCFFHNQPAA